MKAAHLVRGWFDTFSEALKMAWRLYKMKFQDMPTPITFAKKCGEIRNASVADLLFWCPSKGFARFSELLPDGSTQYRAFRFERVKF